ncbi:hypothetical protein Hanom_Chr15g01412491 [Helianthus anomalus]
MLFLHFPVFTYSRSDSKQNNQKPNQIIFHPKTSITQLHIICKQTNSSFSTQHNPTNQTNPTSINLKTTKCQVGIKQNHQIKTYQTNKNPKNVEICQIKKQNLWE